MLSALKKKLGSNNNQQNNGLQTSETSKTRSGINPVSAELQKRFANGVNFNMKIVIRGDRNSGKTCLWNRIQGKPFMSEYYPTDEIQATNIVWNYRASDYIVKIDVWDVVDESPKRRIKSDGLKLNNIEVPQYETPACDAGFVDVYKNCNGVLMIFDITKPWTWKYIERELEKVPSHIPVLILSNKTDLENERQIREEEIKHFLKNFKRPPPLSGKIMAEIRYTQSSMKNAYGLKYLYTFLNIPFLFLQRETLENMLESNKREIELSYQELDYSGTNKEESYDSYTKNDSEVQNHAFSHENKKAAISEHQKDAEIAPSTSATSTPKRRRDSSSSDDQSNKMVDMFEEDFDSNDEDVHFDVYSKKIDQLQPEIEKRTKRDSNSSVSSNENKSTLKMSSKVVEDGNKKGSVGTTPGPVVKGPSIDLDSWLETSPDADAVNISAIKIESSGEDNCPNPLVSKPEGESDDDEDDNSLISHHEVIKSTEETISTGSSMGFSILKSPESSKKIKPKSNKKSEKSENTKKKRKKKTNAITDEKKKNEKKAQKSDLLIEDLKTPENVDEYESL